MTNRRDDWDGDERETLDGLEAELAEIRRRHQDDPSLAMLRAAAGDALPQDLQARVDNHLRDSAWSRTIVDGLRDAGAGDHLDSQSEDLLFARITRSANAESAGSSRRSWKPALMMGGLALAASVLLAIVVSRPRTLATPDPVAAPARTEPPQAAQQSGRSKFAIAYAKPDVKLSPAALTWRGTTGANPFLAALAPAFDAYRAGDYAKAVAAFDQLATTYPTSIEVLFYRASAACLPAMTLLPSRRSKPRPACATRRLLKTLVVLAVARVRSGDLEAGTVIERSAGVAGRMPPKLCCHCAVRAAGNRSRDSHDSLLAAC